MTKVEDAIHQLLKEFEVLSDCTLYIANDLDSAIDSLIAAVEGKTRETIWGAQLIGYRVQASQFPDDERRNCRVETDVNGVAYTLVPTSTLAPKAK